MRKRWLLLALLTSLSPLSARGAKQISIAVMEFSSKGGVSQNQMDALEDLLANEIRKLGDYQVVGKADIRAALELNEQQNLLGCTETACIAEIGGALGVRWVMLGNISQFGNTWLLNLKVMDVKRMKVAASYSRSVRGTQDKLIDLLPIAVQELFSKAHHKMLAGSKPTAGPTRTPAASKPVDPTHRDTQLQTEESRPKEEMHASRWFSSAGEAGFFLSLNLGAYMSGKLGVSSDLNCPNGTSECVDLSDVEQIAADQTRSGPMLGLSAGYTFSRWISLYGQVGAAFTTGQTRNQDARKATEISLIAGIKSAWPTDRWIEPLAYAELGISWYQDKNDSTSTTAFRSEIRGAGPMFNLGLGADIHITPNWFSGLRVGLMIRRWGDDKTIRITNGDNGPGVQLGWINGWMF